MMVDVLVSGQKTYFTQPNFKSRPEQKNLIDILITWSMKTDHPLEEWLSLYHLRMASSERTSVLYNKRMILLNVLRKFMLS